MRFQKKALLWSGLYLLLIATALLIARIDHQHESRGFWIEFGVGLGFAGLAVMGLQFVLTARFRTIAAPFGLDELLHFHRQAGFIATWLIAGHVVVLFAADPSYLSFLDPRINTPRALSLSGLIIILSLLIFLTLRRKKTGLSYEWWRATHGLFALIVTLIGLAHILMVGFYISELWQQLVWIGMTGGATLLLLQARLVKPLLMKRQPYQVSSVRRENERVYTLEIVPQGHAGMRFEAGQFVWLTLGDSPFTLQQHPFTISSSPDLKSHYELTIKESGDFTRMAADTTPGTGAFLEGPYGTFVLPEKADPLTVMIAGGIGITPFASMLRTAGLRNDRRPFLLFYGNDTLQKAIFLDELKELKNHLVLQLVEVLEHPPEEWAGERGVIDRELLLRHLPEDPVRTRYYLCGPGPMMDAIEPSLRNLGVPMEQIHSERFEIV